MENDVEQKHIMFSYSWEHKNDVNHIYSLVDNEFKEILDLYYTTRENKYLKNALNYYITNIINIDEKTFRDCGSGFVIQRKCLRAS